ncbi:MAG: hypothetical protein F6K11_09170 [Leptolyngbya sp. SIO3F4]|nr:hypothetical protein [Leptolyngbya sp. SIO3F4]
MEKRFIFLSTNKLRQSQPIESSNSKPSRFTSPSYDSDTLIGLLLLFTLTGLATVGMVVDVKAVMQTFRPESPPPVESQYEIAKRPSIFRKLNNNQ